MPSKLKSFLLCSSLSFFFLRSILRLMKTHYKHSKELKCEAIIHNFPEEIIHDILLRLPLKSLIKCTSVCKPWRSLIKNPSFIHAHLNRTIRFNNQYDTHLLLLHCAPRAIRSSDVHNPRTDTGKPMEWPIDEYSLHYDNHAFDEYSKIEIPIVPKEKLGGDFLRVVGTCNGLVFLADDKDCAGYTFIICNPSIRKSVTLPMPHLIFETCGPYSACHGFGFDAITNDYKVVRLLTDQCENPTSFEVYSLATGLWSNPRIVDPKCEFTHRQFQAFVNGAIHWFAYHSDCRHFILAFDVGSELFREIMMPKSFTWEGSANSQLSVTGDGKSIAIFTNSMGYLAVESLDIWVMKEYSVEDSWTKLITLNSQGPHRSVPYKPLCFRKSGEVVLVLSEDYHRRHELVSLDLVSKQFKNLGIREYKYYNADSYEESLVLLEKADAFSY